MYTTNIVEGRFLAVAAIFDLPKNRKAFAHPVLELGLGAKLAGDIVH